MKPGPLQSQWLADLRSGKYPQTRKRLQDETGYCCLGVATAITCGMVGRKDTGLMTFGAEGRTSILPEEVFERMKFRTKQGAPASDNLPYLTDLNDDLRWTFEQIADHVEKYLDQYFLEAA